jgi:hypothetical protein
VCSEIGISAQSPGVSVESDQLDTEFYDSGEQFLGGKEEVWWIGASSFALLRSCSCSRGLVDSKVTNLFFQ